MPNAPGHSTPPEPAGNRSIAERLRGFGPLGILAILVIVAGSLLGAWVGALLVLSWVGWSRTPWRDIGYSRPTRWARTVAAGIVFGIAFK